MGWACSSNAICEEKNVNLFSTEIRTKNLPNSSAPNCRYSNMSMALMRDIGNAYKKLVKKTKMKGEP